MNTKKIKILLISLIGSTDNIGIKYLHAALKKEGHDSSILFYTSDDESFASRIANFVQENCFDMVGVSLMSMFLRKAKHVSSAIRAVCGEKPIIIWGGTHPTLAPYECQPYADYIFVGEAEDSLINFIDNLILNDNIKYSINHSQIITCSIINDLDRLAYPEYYSDQSFITHGDSIMEINTHLFKKYSRYNGSYLSVISSRGCPYRCSYCSNAKMQEVVGRNIRRRSAESTVQEIRMNINKSPFNIAFVNFWDDNFLSHSSEWLELFNNYYNMINIPIIFRTRPEFVTEDKIKYIVKMPVGLASIGLQSGSERTNREIYNRKFSKEKFLRCTKILSNYRIPSHYDVIVDNPYERIDDIENTIDIISKLPSTSSIILCSLTFYINTPLYYKAKADGIDVDAHKEKSQGNIDNKSKETRLIYSALFWPKSITTWLLHNDTRLSRFILYMISFLTRSFFMPLRMIKLAYLSQQKNPVRFIKTLYTYSIQVFFAIYLRKPAKLG